MDIFKHSSSKCPACMNPLGNATPIDGCTFAPDVPDYVLCCNCGHICWWDGNKHRHLTRGEKVALRLHPEAGPFRAEQEKLVRHMIG